MGGHYALGGACGDYTRWNDLQRYRLERPYKSTEVKHGNGLGYWHGMGHAARVGAVAMGRPSKLTPQVQARICRAIRRGMSLPKAAKYGGIDYATFKLWMRKGRESKSGKFFAFYAAIQRTKAVAEAAILTRIDKAGKGGDWRADAWLLTHAPRFKDDYSDVSTSKVDATVTWLDAARSAGISDDEANAAHAAAVLAAVERLRGERKAAEGEAGE